jgi:hypothetical protein
VSIYDKVTQKDSHRAVPLRIVLDGIKSGRWGDSVGKARAEYQAHGKTEVYDALKKALLAFTPAGVFPKRHKEGITTPSGILPIDLDDLTDDCLSQAIRDLRSDTHVAYCLKSPSGAGAKGGLRIPLTTDDATFKERFSAAEQYLQEKYGLILDPSGKDICRLCFVSYDPSIYINPDAVVFTERRAAPNPAHALAPTPRKTLPLNIDDSTLIDKMLSADNGAKVSRLWAGDYSEYAKGDNDGESEGDLALCAHLAFWTSKNASRIDRLFRQSGLMRDKWDRDDYRERTISRAIAFTRETYNPPSEIPESVDSADGGVEPTQQASQPAGSLPVIRVNNVFVRTIAKESLAAIHAKNDPPTLFNMGKILVRIDRSGVETERVDATILRHMLERCANYVKVGLNETRADRVPNDLPGDLLSLQENGLPELKGISPIPVFLPDGRLLSTNGYDEDSGIFLCMRGMDSVRSDMRIVEALAWLQKELLVNFPFVSDAGKAHAIAMLIELFVRTIINGPRMMYLVDAPEKGTGKSLLARILSMVIAGNDATMMVLPQREEEIEKRITAVLLSGVPIAIFDNTKKIDSESIAALITSTIWQGRELGRSKMLPLPNNALWVATGNNVDLSDEAVRRVASIRLDTGMANPEDRQEFKHDPLPDWVRENRVNIVSAILSIVQAWVDAGMPPGKETAGGFERWARVLGGILANAGIEGFLQDRKDLRAESDQITQEWISVCAIWATIHGRRSIATSTLFNDVIRPNRLLLKLWADKTDLQAAVSISHALRRNRNRVFGEWVINVGEVDTHTKNKTYCLKPRTTAQPPHNHRTTTADTSLDKSSSSDDSAVVAVVAVAVGKADIENSPLLTDSSQCPQCGCKRIKWEVDCGTCQNADCGAKVISR